MILGYQRADYHSPNSHQRIVSALIRHMKVMQSQFAFYAFKSTTDYIIITVLIH